jgi:hypothetical protein
MIPLHCGFCGKGPFPTQAGLNKHISQTKSCHRASQDDIRVYLTNARHERGHTPDSSTQDENPTPAYGNPSVEMEGMRTLDDDINVFGAEIDLDTPVVQRVERDDDDEDHTRDTQAFASDIVFVEPFPEDAKAGAIWGKAKPNFQVLRDRGLGDTDWRPFVIRKTANLLSALFSLIVT